MTRHIELHKKDIAYTLRVSKRARRMRLAVYCDGAFVVTVPQQMNQSVVEKFIIEKSRWILDKLEYFRGLSGTVFVRGGKREFTAYKQEALVLAQKRIEHFNKIYGFTFNKINIKNQKTRWGSCSRKGNLNFNYKISLLPPHLADYLVVHELCHLGEFNHSRKFWALVERALPEYRDLRKELRKIGAGYGANF